MELLLLAVSRELSRCDHRAIQATAYCTILGYCIIEFKANFVPKQNEMALVLST